MSPIIWIGRALHLRGFARKPGPRHRGHFPDHLRSPEAFAEFDRRRWEFVQILERDIQRDYERARARQLRQLLGPYETPERFVPRGFGGLDLVVFDEPYQ